MPDTQCLDPSEARGAIVGDDPVGGDGVNDAPALKKADIGIAMGRRGTRVTRETADMVLRDDAFGTVIEAMRVGRRIFDNIRKFFFYPMSCNVSEVSIVGLAVGPGLPTPHPSLQIRFLNLVAAVFPSLCPGSGKARRARREVIADRSRRVRKPGSACAYGRSGY